MGHQKGEHPTAGEADTIVLDSCAPEFPKATLTDKVCSMYPLTSERVIFTSRVVKKTTAAGYAIHEDKIPCGDDDTLGTVSAAVVTNAEA